MLEQRARCQCCGAEHQYSLFGGVYYGTSAHYGLCPECSKKVDDTLKSIPKRYESIKTEIYTLPDGFKEKVQELHDNPPKKPQSPWDLDSNNFRDFSVVTLDNGYEFSCSVVYRGCKYSIESRSEDNIFADDTKVYAFLEYDLLEKKTTGKPWLEKGDEEGNYVKHVVCNWVDNFRSISEEEAKTLAANFSAISSPFGPWVPSLKSNWPNPSSPTSDP